MTQRYAVSRLIAFLSLLCIHLLGYTQATLPVSRTVWNAGEPTGWTQTGCGNRTTSSACSGNNARIFDNTGDFTTVNFNAAPGNLVFKLVAQGMSGESSLLVEQSPDGTGWTTLGRYGTATGATTISTCADITLALAANSRYVRWTYTKATGNCDLDDVNIAASPFTAPIANTGTPAAGNVAQGTTNHVFSTFTISPTTSIDFTNVTISTSGSATTSDVSNFRIIYDVDGDGVIDVGDNSVVVAAQSLAATMAFVMTGQTGFSAARRYLVVGDVAGGATLTRTLTTSVTAATNYVTTGTEGGTAIGNTQTIVAPPNVAYNSATAVGVGTATQGDVDRLVYRPILVVTNAPATLTQFTVTTAGSYTASDLVNIRLWYQNNNGTLNTGTATLLGTLSGAGIGPGLQTFNFSQVLPVGTANLFVTISLNCNALSARTFNVNFTTTANFAVTTPATKSGSGAPAGGVQTIGLVTPSPITGLTATPNNTQVGLNWTNPTGCLDEVLVVARSGSAPTGTPSGDGSAYTANSLYSVLPATAFGGGFVSYKGTGSGFTLTGLTNGTTYHIYVWVRKGSNWSTAVSLTTVPNPLSAATDYFRSKSGSGNWNSTATWESSPDDATWYNATLVPTTSAAAIRITNGSTVSIVSAVTIDKTTIQNGGTLVLRNDGNVTQSGSIALSNATGDQLTIQNGGVFQQVVTSSNTSYNYTSLINYQSTGNIVVQTGGIIRTGDGTNSHVATGYSGFAHPATASQVSWANGAIYDWFATSVQAPATSNVTYFPSAGVGVSPILRLSATTSGTFGASGGNATQINGILEVNANNNLSNTATKTIRDGIRGTATLTVTCPLTLSTSASIIGGSVTINIGTSGTLTLSQGTNIPAGANVTITTSLTNYSINKQSGTFNVLGTVDMTTVQIGNSSGSVVLAATGWLKTARATGFSGTSATIVSGTITLNSGCTVELNAAGNQTLNSRADFYNIVLSNSGTKTPSGTFSPVSGGTITIQGAAIFDCTGHNVGNATTNLTMSGTSRLIVSTAVTNPAPEGVYSLTGGTVQFTNSSVTDQTIRNKAYYNVEVSGTNVKNSNGNITINNGGTFTVKNGGIFEINADVIEGPTGTQSVVVETAARSG